MPPRGSDQAARPVDLVPLHRSVRVWVTPFFARRFNARASARHQPTPNRCRQIAALGEANGPDEVRARDYPRSPKPNVRRFASRCFAVPSVDRVRRPADIVISATFVAEDPRRPGFRFRATRGACHGTHVTRRRTEGRNTTEVMRCWKRYVVGGHGSWAMIWPWSRVPPRQTT